MSQYDLVILTQDDFIQPDVVTPFIQQIQHEESLIVNAVTRKGYRAIRKSWSDKEFDWYSARSAIFRSTWDYFERLSEFIDTIQLISTKTRLFNSYELFKWNLDKRYLLNLEEKGVNIVPTKYVQRRESIPLESFINEFQNHTLIIKPAISATAFNTYVVNMDNLTSMEEKFSQLVSSSSMLVQPYQESITSLGEISYVVIDGAYSHAIRKLPKKGDFRVQDDFGGTFVDHQPDAHEIEFAQLAVSKCPERPQYARVDAIRDNTGSLSLMELELIEPELWFRNCPDGVTKLVDAIVSQLK